MVNGGEHSENNQHDTVVAIERLYRDGIGTTDRRLD